jgi:beta-N-acetylhexosaminidase
MNAEVEDHAGAVLVVGFEGEAIPPDVATAITRRQVGGVILFGRNFSDVDACRALCRELRDLSRDLLISIDQEGGRVQRLRAPFPELPPMRRLGATRSPALARRAGALLGRALRSVGVHQDYAPVLDVDSNPNNPVIGDRAFGASPEIVAEMGAAFVDGLQSAGVAACGKHFPGHGDTATDSHHALPVVRADVQTLERRELAPFRALAATDIAAMMTAHVVFESLDAVEPATFSPAIVEPLLRRRFGFRGVVVSDDLEMGAVSRSIPEAAVAALGAGCDQLLVCSRPEDAAAAREAIVAAVSRGQLAGGRLAEAAGRVQRLRGRFVGPAGPVVSRGARARAGRPRRGHRPGERLTRGQS